MSKNVAIALQSKKIEGVARTTATCHGLYVVSIIHI